jgi:hypothetical protein
VIYRILELQARGLTRAQIAQELNGDGLTTPTGLPWVSKRVKNALKKRGLVNSLVPARSWPSAADRVAMRLKPADDGSGCLLFQGYTDENGYGRVRVGSVRRRAHRIAFEEHYGAIPEGWQLHHSCGTHNCCNVFHLTAVPGTTEHAELAKSETAIADSFADGTLHVEAAVYTALDDSPEHPARVGALATEAA